jgi:hypothetical protein
MNLSCSAALADGYPIKLLLLLRFPRKKSLFRQHVKELPICTTTLSGKTYNRADHETLPDPKNLYPRWR